MYLINSLKKFGPSIKKYSKSLFFSRKNKNNNRSSKKEFFTVQNIESFIKKSPNNYCQKKNTSEFPFNKSSCAFFRNQQA
jgi:hypothetical protein